MLKQSQSLVQGHEVEEAEVKVRSAYAWLYGSYRINSSGGR